MASIRKRGQNWQAQIRRQGHPPIVKTFIKKADAEAWARQTEVALEREDFSIAPSNRQSPQLSVLLMRYSEEITPKKRGADAEQYRIKTLLKHEIAQTPISKLSSSAVARYRDDRLRLVSSSSVRRELVILRHCLEVARKEWDAPYRENPVHNIELPTDGKARQRRLTTKELKALLAAADKCRNKMIKPVIRFAIATGMRRGEILDLLWSDIDENNRTATIQLSKNGEARTIPLSGSALDILAGIPRSTDRTFPVSANALRLAWERTKIRAGLVDLRFHDLRHEAVSRFFELGLSVPEVAMISGHKDPRMLFRYTHPRASEVAKKLEY